MVAGRVSGFEGEFIHSQLYEIHSVSCAYVLVSVSKGVEFQLIEFQGEFLVRGSFYFFLLFSLVLLSKGEIFC